MRLDFTTASRSEPEDSNLKESKPKEEEYSNQAHFFFMGVIFLTKKSTRIYYGFASAKS